MTLPSTNTNPASAEVGNPPRLDFHSTVCLTNSNPGQTSHPLRRTTKQSGMREEGCKLVCTSHHRLVGRERQASRGASGSQPLPVRSAGRLQQGKLKIAPWNFESWQQNLEFVEAETCCLWWMWTLHNFRQRMGGRLVSLEALTATFLLDERKEWNCCWVTGGRTEEK